MSAKEVLRRLASDLKPAFDHGRSEVAAALFQGNAYVMYPSSEPGQAELPLAAEVAEQQPQAMGMDELRALAREYHPEHYQERDAGMEM